MKKIIFTILSCLVLNGIYSQATIIQTLNSSCQLELRLSCGHAPIDYSFSNPSLVTEVSPSTGSLPSPTVPIILSSITGTVDLIIDYDAWGCSGYGPGNMSTITITLTPSSMGPNPPTSASATPSTICVGSSSTLSATGCSGTVEWYTNSAGTGSPLPSSTVSPSSNTTYYAFCIVGGCKSISGRSVNVMVTTPPTAGTLSGNQNICVGSSTTFTPSQGGGTWSSNNTSIASVAAGVVTGNAAGTATITYTVPGTGGCASASVTRTVTVTAPPNAGTLSGNQNICVGSSTTFTTSSMQGGTWSSSNSGIATITSTGVGTATISGVAAGTATITYTVNGTGGCPNATATRTVTVTAPPNAGTLSGNQNICVGNSTSFTTSSMQGGTWSSSNSSIATITSTGVGTATISGVAAGTATITYTVIGTGGCPNATATRTVTVTAPPNAGTLSGNQNICVGNSTTFTTSSMQGGTWSSSNSGIATITSTGVGAATISGVAAGTATITYTVIGTGGCPNATATRTVTVTAPPNAGTLSGNQNICVGNSTTFTTSSMQGGTWSSSNSGIATITSTGVGTATISGVAAGTATITYTVNGTGGCPNATATRTVTVTAPPNAGTLSGNQNICMGSSTTFSSTQGGGTWSSSNTSIATVDPSGDVTGVTAGTATITYTVNGTGGCPNATATRTVTVTAPPNAGTLSGNQNICVGSSTTFSSTQPGGGFLSSNTSIATVTSSGLSSATVSGISAGTATISYIINGTWGCPNDTATRTVTVTTPPNAGTLSGNQNICIGSTTTFSSTQTGGTWSSGSTSIATVNSSTGVITGVAAGTATITYTVNGTGGCSNATATRTVTIAGAILGDTTELILCPGDSALIGGAYYNTIGVYGDTMISSSNCDSIVYTRLIGDTILPTITSCANDTTVYADASCMYTLGDYTGVSSIVVTDNCSTQGVDIAITQSPLAGSTITSDTVVWIFASDASGNMDSCSFNVTIADSTAPVITSCANDTTIYVGMGCSSILGDYTSNSNIAVTDNCSTLGTDIVITQSPNAGSVITSDTIVWIFATDASGNVDSCSFIVTLNDTIAPVIVSCLADTILPLSANCDVVLPDFTSSSNFVVTDNCATQGGDLTVSQSPTAGTIITTNTIVWMFATDGNGNMDSCSFNVTVADVTAPVITSCISDQSIETDKYCNITIEDYTNHNELIYSDNCSAQGIDLVVTQSIPAGTVIDTDTTLWLFVTDGAGNVDSCSFAISLTDCGIIIPETFSPNGNGQNEIFYIENLDAFPSTSIIIYNRWGTEVFQSDDYQNDWDGRSQSKYNIAGDELPEGTYYYLLTLGGDQANPNYGKVYKGYVYLKR